MRLTHREVAVLWSAFRASSTKNGDLAVAVDAEDALRPHAEAIGIEEKQVKEISEIETVDVTAEKATWRHLKKVFEEVGEKGGWASFAVRAAFKLGPKLTEAAKPSENGKEAGK